MSLCNDECIGRALDEICDDHLPLLHEDCRAKLAEARALLHAIFPFADCWDDERGLQDDDVERARAWLAANPGTEAKR